MRYFNINLPKPETCRYVNNFRFSLHLFYFNGHMHTSSLGKVILILEIKTKVILLYSVFVMCINFITTNDGHDH